MMQLRADLEAQGHSLQLAFIHQEGTEDWVYKMAAAIDGDAPLLQDVPAHQVRTQLQAERGDMFVYGTDGRLALYLLARRPDYDFNEPDGYARFLSDVADQF